MYVTYHQFALIDSGQSTGSWIRVENGLIGVGTGAALIDTGIHTGFVTLAVQARHAPPETVELDGWDEVVEVGLTAPVGQLRPGSLEMGCDPFPALTLAGPGDYRVRVHAQGRDGNVDGVDAEPRERYLVVVWPAAPEPELVHRRTDVYGGSVRRSVARFPRVPEPRPDPRRALIEETLHRAREERGR